jgi:hypothetical protein
MAKWGMSPEVTGPEGTTAGMQVSQLLSRIGSDVGEAETKARASIQEQDKVVSKLQIKYKEALAKGDMELANTYMAQLTALSGEYAKYLTAQAESLKGGLSDISPIDIKDIITTVSAETSPQLKTLLDSGSTLAGLNTSITNPQTGKADGIWKQTDIQRWATDLAFEQLQVKYYDQGKRPINKDQAFQNQVTANVSLLFKDANPTVLDASEGNKKNTETSTIISEDDDTKGSAKTTILDF